MRKINPKSSLENILIKKSLTYPKQSFDTTIMHSTRRTTDSKRLSSSRNFFDDYTPPSSFRLRRRRIPNVGNFGQPESSRIPRSIEVLILESK